MRNDPDARLRASAFARLDSLRAIHGDVLADRMISAPWTVDGAEMFFKTRARGIFKPKAMSTVLSITTVMPRAGRETRYADQPGPAAAEAESQVFTEAATPFRYSFMGDDPEAGPNLLMREAMALQVPLIWFWAVAPSVYRPIAPVFVIDWDRHAREVALAPALEERAGAPLPEPDLRAYAIRQSKQRQHQALFRARVVSAYRGRCALSGLPVSSLVDAAHIVEDRDERLGQPVVSNGLCLSKLHHAAFDAHLIGIDTDRRVHIAERLILQRDGPMLEAIKSLHGRRLELPRLPENHPDPARLKARFAQFIAAAG